MSGAEPVPERSVAEYITLFDLVISWALASAQPGDWNKLQRRLDGLSSRLHVDAGDRGRSNGRDRAYRLEGKLWIELLIELLHPEVLARLARTLLEDGDVLDPRVWAPLDVAAFAKEAERRRRREVLADAAVLAALRQYASVPRYARLLEGVRALEELHAARISTEATWDEAILAQEARRLGESITNMMPPRLRLALRETVETLLRSELEGTPVEDLQPARAFWHHKLPYLGFWAPAFSHILSTGGYEEVEGTWLRPKFQADYEAGLEADRSSVAEEHGAAESVPASDVGSPRAEAVDEAVADAAGRSVQQIPDAPEQEVSGRLAPDAFQRSEPVEKTAPAATGSMADPDRRGILEAVAEPGPDEELIRSLAEKRLKAWCTQQGIITPKHLVSDYRDEMREHFEMEVRQTLSDRK